MDALDLAIREFSPVDGNWLPLEALFEKAFSAEDPRVYYHAIFNLFERFPDEDGAGVFWSAVHGMEAEGGYENLLAGYFRRWPGFMTRAMLRRMQKSGTESINGKPIHILIGLPTQ